MASPKVQKCGSMARLFGGIHFDLIVGLNISSPSSEDCQVITNSCLPYSVYMCVWVWDTVWKRVMYYLAWCRTWFDIVLIRRNHRLSLHLDTHTHTHTHACCPFSAWLLLKCSFSGFFLLFPLLRVLLLHLVLVHLHSSPLVFIFHNFTITDLWLLSQLKIEN